jgi:L-ascorbate metabolism protein UlaG (beta-lactamase superfamily)
VNHARVGQARVSRRRLLAGGAAAAALALLEYESLRGAFDHRRALPPSGRERYRASLESLDAEGDTALGAIVHVGHSTHLISVAGARLLTDPWFYDPAFGALSHVAAPAVAPEDVGKLDAVLITHDHADHADRRALDRLDKRALAIVATDELAAAARRLGFARVTVLAPWSSLTLGNARVSAVPGVHDIYEVGYVVEGAGRSVYFAGDTRLFDGLAAIAERFAPTAAILPVDGTRLTGGALHVMTPDDAVQATATLGARLVMPSHAEAYLSDPLARYVLASTILGAPAIFAEKMKRQGKAACEVPAPGALVRLPAREG